jgi:hypothetical protein
MTDAWTLPSDFSGRRGTYDPDRVCEMAISLTRARGWFVVPMVAVTTETGSVKKIPTIKGWPERCANTEAAIRALWRERPGPLIGVVMGKKSGIVLLDFDVKHPEALAWFATNKARLPDTLTYRSYSGGSHRVYACPEGGLRSINARPVVGIDVKADGGLWTFWFAIGTACLNTGPIAPWPAWLTPVIWPPKPPLSPRRERQFSSAHPDRAIEGILGRMAREPEGNRNSLLFWAAKHLAPHIRTAGISRREAESRLEAAALTAGMTERDDGITATIKSGLDAGAAP